MAQLHLTPRAGHIVAMDEIPTSDICSVAPAAWDARTIHGPWAYMCESCAARLGSHYPTTGVGIGQRLTLREETQR